MVTQTDKVTEDLKAEVRELRADMGKIAESLKRLGNGQVENAAERVREFTHQGQEQLKRAGSAVAEQVETRPGTSLAVAFVGGLMVGVLLSRRGH
ncbi:MAG: DUF883 family protein [Kiloniellales bacterium]